MRKFQNASIEAWISNGAARNKILLGLAAYGRTFHLTNLNETDTGSPFNGPGEPGRNTLEPGLLAYYEVSKYNFL